MIPNQGVHILYLMLAMLLPLSALLSRRMPLKQALPMIAVWIGVFLVVMLGIGLARENGLRAGWARLTQLIGSDEQRVHGRTVRLRLAPDGHFWATATIDGVDRRMLIDSGATTTSLSVATAHKAALDLDQNPTPTTVSTANGMVFARTSSIRQLKLGPIVADDLRVVVAPEFGDTDVLGMNFLSRLKSWKVEGDMLVLEPNA
jgi:aspartyl protease family protein